MKEYSTLRWQRLIELGLEFTYIKSLIKEKYNYEVKETTIELLIDNIKNYRDINETELLNLLERETYKKISVMHVAKFKNNKGKIPIIDDLNNNILTQIFKEANDISIKDSEYYNGQLTEYPKVTYYNKDKNFVTIKMSYIFNYQGEDIVEENGDEDIAEISESKYDCYKFVIDLKNNLVLMFFNDIKIGNRSMYRQVAFKKMAFRNLFNINKSHMIRYLLNRYLEKYFYDYIKEINDNNVRKLVSIIQASSAEVGNVEKSLIRSIKNNFEHSQKRLDAIVEAIEDENLTISEIESSINGNLIDIQMKGELLCVNSFFYREVIDEVCKELFNGYKPY